jgi:hypothetical protein
VSKGGIAPLLSPPLFSTGEGNYRSTKEVSWVKRTVLLAFLVMSLLTVFLSSSALADRKPIWIDGETTTATIASAAE